MNRISIAIILLSLLGLTGLSFGQKVGEAFSPWKEGYLDIHHINTGKGDAAFHIFPDGTTMIFDAGHHNRPPGPRELLQRPNDSRSPGEWIARYITHMLGGNTEGGIDYALVSHFHTDHMGGVNPDSLDSKHGPYKLAGITDVGDRIKINTLIDRDYPNYDYPRPIKDARPIRDDETIDNYLKFTAYQKAHNGLKMERFLPGKKDQVTLVHKADAFPEFEIRNIIANGVIWTGKGEETRKLFPEPGDEGYSNPAENMCSLAIRLSYGKFAYYTGGDLPGVPTPGSPEWMDVETPVGQVIGPVDVHVLNHHGFVDTGNDNFVKSLKPRIHILQTWAASHPAHSTLSRLQSKRLYSGERDIFATNIKEETKVVIGAALDKLKSQQGHIVIRVAPGGDQYHIYILDDAEESFTIKAIFGPYQSGENN